MIRIGVIGYGYWGPNLVRNFVETSETQVIAVADMRQDRLELVQCRYPGVEVTKDYRDILKHPKIDAVAISTPVSTHFPLALEALQAGKHVLVEKPMTTTSQEAMRLIDEASREISCSWLITRLSIPALFVKSVILSTPARSARSIITIPPASI